MHPGQRRCGSGVCFCHSSHAQDRLTFRCTSERASRSRHAGPGPSECYGRSRQLRMRLRHRLLLSSLYLSPSIAHTTTRHPSLIFPSSCAAELNAQLVCVPFFSGRAAALFVFSAYTSQFSVVCPHISDLAALSPSIALGPAISPHRGTCLRKKLPI